MFTVEKLQELLHIHDDGVLKGGGHNEGRDFCAMEFIAKIAGEPWTDKPQCVHFALAAYCRQLNDSTWPSDALRTKTMLPLLAEVFGTRDLPIVMSNISLHTIRNVVPIALETAAELHPTPEHKEALTAAMKVCRDSTADSAARAARAAYSADSAAARAAYAAIVRKLIPICPMPNQPEHRRNQ